MPKASIHIKVGNVNFIIHSTRNNFSYSVVFTDEKNEHLNDAKTALRIYREELAKRALAYTQATGQKLQKNTATILSAVVNLNKEHTLKDLEPILKKLEKDLDTKIISASIHRDEGTLIEKSTGKKFFSGEDFALNRDDKKLYWIDPNTKEFLEPIDLEQFEIKKNYHAHIEFLGIDSNGKAIKRNRLNRHYLSNLQTFVANTLQMERGRKHSKDKHKDPHEFKKIGVAKRQAQEELEKKATIKALKEINKQIRAQLKEKHAQREHYAKWEAYYKELQEFVKTKKPTMGKVMERIGNFIGELLQEIENLQAENEQSKAELAKVKDLKELNKQLREQLKQAHARRSQYAQLEQFVKELKEKVKNKEFTIQQLQEQMQQMQSKLLAQIEQKDKKIEQLSKINSSLNRHLLDTQKENAQLKEQVQQLQNAPAPTPKVVTKEVEKIVYKEDKTKIEQLKKELDEQKRKNAELWEELQARKHTIKEINQKLDIITQRLNEIHRLWEEIKEQERIAASDDVYGWKRIKAEKERLKLLEELDKKLSQEETKEKLPPKDEHEKEIKKQAQYDEPTLDELLSIDDEPKKEQKKEKKKKKSRNQGYDIGF